MGTHPLPPLIQLRPQPRSRQPGKGPFTGTAGTGIRRHRKLGIMPVGNHGLHRHHIPGPHILEQGSFVTKAESPHAVLRPVPGSVHGIDQIGPPPGRQLHIPVPGRKILHGVQSMQPIGFILRPRKKRHIHRQGRRPVVIGRPNLAASVHHALDRRFPDPDAVNVKPLPVAMRHPHH